MTKAGPGTKIIVLPGSYGAYTWPSGKNGTASAPITLEAQTRAITIANHVPQKAAASARAKFGKISLNGTQYVRIDGVNMQSVWMSGASWIEVRNAYMFGDASRGVSVASTNHVMLHDNLLENFTKSPTNSLAWFTDYGMFFYPGTDFDVYNNVWNGGFNHAISTKTSTKDLLITGNYFYNCGRHCIELGQQTDGNSTDRTSQNIQIRKNLFSMTDSHYVNAAYQITIYNADDVTVDDNEFRNFNTSSILISMLESVYCSSKGEKLSNVGIKPNYTKLSKLRFVGGKPLIKITTRGISGDKVEFADITGTTCDVLSGIPGGVPGPCGWAPGFPETTSPPTLTYLDSSIHCN
jgi:hypothetical protein